MSPAPGSLWEGDLREPVPPPGGAGRPCRQPVRRFAIEAPEGLPAPGEDEFNRQRGDGVPAHHPAPGRQIRGTAAAPGALGRPVVLPTNLTADAWAGWARVELASPGVEVRVPRDCSHAQVHLVATEGARRRRSLAYPGAPAVPDALPPARWCLPAGCPHPTISELETLARRAPCTTLLDIGPDLGQGFTVKSLAAVLSCADGLPGDEREFVSVAGTDPVSAATVVAARVRGGAVVKRGPRGCSAFFPDGAAPLHAPAVRVEAGNTIGAGGGFNAGGLYGLGEGWPWTRVLTFANAVAAWADESASEPVAREVTDRAGAAARPRSTSNAIAAATSVRSTRPVTRRSGGVCARRWTCE